jgi:hypothetical protein
VGVEMRYINGQIVLNEQECKDFLFCLTVVRDNQNMYDDKKLNRDSVKAFQTLSQVAVRFGLID